MKKLIWISLACVGTAFANQPVVNQQFVMATPSSQPKLQQPFNSQTNSRLANSNVRKIQKNPMNIYVKPKTQQAQSEPHRYAQQQQEKPYQGQPYQNNSYNNPQQNAYDANNQPQQPQGQQNQSMQWQSRPNTQQPAQKNYQRPYQNQYHNNYPTQRPPQQYERNTAPTNAHNTAPANTSTTAPTAPRYTVPENVPANSAAPAHSTAPQGINNSTPSKSSSPYNNTAKTEWFKNCLSAVTTKQLASSARAFCECGWQKISQGGIDPKLFTSTNPADIQRANVLLQNISQACLMQVVQGR